MSRFRDIPEDYLEDASIRIEQMLKICNLNVEVFRYIDPHATPPFWWIYLSRIQLPELSQSISRQFYTLACRYVIGYATESIDGKIQQSIYKAIPRSLVYLYAHKNLMFDALDGSLPYSSPPRYLDSSAVTIDPASTFGVYKDNSNHVGIEIEITLPYTMNIDQEFG